MLRRVARHLVTILAGLSLLLFVATCGLWVRSYLGGDYFQWLRDTPGESHWVRRIFDVRSARGGVMFTYIHSPTDDPGGIRSFREDAKIQPRFQHNGLPTAAAPVIEPVSSNRGQWSGFMGFGYDAGYFGLRSPPRVWQEQLLLPYWFVAAAAALLPALWLRKALRKRRRFARGLCQTCGYDLRATPQRCPECGTMPDESEPQMNADERG